jgi:hypothetical protein
MREWVSLALMGLGVVLAIAGMWAVVTGAFLAGIIFLGLGRVVFWFGDKLEPLNKPDE